MDPGSHEQLLKKHWLGETLQTMLCHYACQNQANLQKCSSNMAAACPIAFNNLLIDHEP